MTEWFRMQLLSSDAVNGVCRMFLLNIPLASHQNDRKDGVRRNRDICVIL